MVKLNTISNSVLNDETVSSVITGQKEDADDDPRTDSDDDDYGDNIFPVYADHRSSNLSAICEYGDFEELD